MKNLTGNKLEKLVFGMFDQMVEGADKYVTKQGSTWLIFTEYKRWVIEFTKDKTLWFNYNLFQSELELIGKNCTEEKDLIKNWFESRFLNTNGVRHTQGSPYGLPKPVEDTIQNGVRHTIPDQTNVLCSVEDTIQNGVKGITPSGYLGSIEMKGKIIHQIETPKQNNEVEDTIQNGVKETQTRMRPPVGAVDETIENGVKTTEWYSGNSYGEVEDTIENGVKDTHFNFQSGLIQVEDVIQNGVKETKENRLLRTINVISTIKNGVKHVEDGDWLDQDERIDDIIENGVKETKEISNISLMSEIFKVKAKQTIRDGVKELKELPDKSGEFRGYGDYYHRQEDITKPHTEYVKEVIEDSYNHMGRVEGVIRNTDKDGI